jgi:preprotein translocase subunit SecD
VRSFGTTKREILSLAARLGEHRVQKVVMESTSVYWKAPFFRLEAESFSCELLDAKQVKALPGRPKTDRADCVWLAKVAERGMVICNASETVQAEYDPAHATRYGVTPPQDDNADDTVVLPNYSGYSAGRYVLAPAEMSGNIIRTATAQLDSQTDEWGVIMDFTSAGSTEFNKYAAAHYRCYKEDMSNPPYCALQAIELDGTVESAPSIDFNSFPGSAEISGSSSAPFTKQEAQSIAFALSYGSLPVRFVSQEVETVSPASPLS